MHHFLCHEIQCLVPGDPLELAFAAFADAHHGIKQPLCRVEPLPVGASAQAGAQLRLFVAVLAEITALLVAAVVGGEAHDDVLPLVGDQHVA